jgi:hypothetical protein
VGTWLLGAGAVKAPPALLAAIVGGKAATGAASALMAGEALRAMVVAKVKSACAVALVIAMSAGGVYLAARPPVPVANASTLATPHAPTTNGAPPPSPLVWTQPSGGAVPAAGADSVTFPNALIAPIAATDTGYYAFGEDASVKRQPDSAPAVFIASLTPDGALIPGMRGWSMSALAWRGKRIEVSAYMRTQDVRDSTGMNVSVTGAQNKVLSNGMNGGPLRIAGTRDWARMATVLDVPPDGCAADRIRGRCMGPGATVDRFVHDAGGA